MAIFSAISNPVAAEEKTLLLRVAIVEPRTQTGVPATENFQYFEFVFDNNPNAIYFKGIIKEGFAVYTLGMLQAQYFCDGQSSPKSWITKHKPGHFYVIFGQGHLDDIAVALKRLTKPL